MTAEELGDRLKGARKEKHMTLRDLAKKSKVSDSAISAWERGLRWPNTYYLKNLCIALEVSADYLIGLDGEAMVAGGKSESKR